MTMIRCDDGTYEIAEARVQFIPAIYSKNKQVSRNAHYKLVKALAERGYHMNGRVPAGLDLPSVEEVADKGSWDSAHLLELLAGMNQTLEALLDKKPVEDDQPEFYANQSGDRVEVADLMAACKLFTVDEILELVP